MENPTEIELCPTEPPSQQTRLSGMKSKKKIIIISYRRLKTHKHLVSRFCCDFSFYEHSIGHLLMQLFIFNAVMCSSKIFYTNTLFLFAPSLKTFYSHYAAPKTIKKI